MAKQYFLFLLLIAGLMSACEDSAVGPTLSINSSPTLTSPTAGANIVLTEATAGDAFDITWTAADFGFQAAVTYAVELDLAGNSFADPVVLGSTSGTALNLTKQDVNTALFITKGLVGEKEADVEMRVRAVVNSDVAAIYSAPVSMKITPFTVVIVYPYLHVPGSYQGWDEKNTTTVIYSLKSNGKYEGYIYFKDDDTEFKFTDGPSWAINWGDDGADGTLDLNAGSNIKVGPKGTYKLNVDINALTYTAVLTNWAVIGSATPNGWGGPDQDMTYDEATGLHTVTMDLVAGEIKFRANDDWPINYGDDGADGRLDFNAPSNITIAEAGNYTISMDLKGPIYTYTIVKN
ncbi:MAG: SusE domain-containing protein [Saprospiraceae bacterium]